MFRASGTNSGVLVTFSDKRLTECQEDTIYRYVADVKSQTDYSAFHALLPDRQWYSGNDTSNYRFGGSNGQEKDDEIYDHGNSFSAEFWQYDPRLGRRWNVDPVVKPWESGYTVFANNPIWFVDPNGADTSFADNETRTQFVETYNDVDNAIKGLDKRIDNKLTKWQKKGYDNERVNKRMSRKIGRLSSARSHLLDIKSSFDEVINSETMFHYSARHNPDGSYRSGGGTNYNQDENRVDIWFYSGLNGTIVHETRHGAGYSRGEWGWNNSTNLPTNYDYQDEYEAYMQESFYTTIISKGIGKSKLEIMNLIKSEYKDKPFIIKEFHQNCEPQK